MIDAPMRAETAAELRLLQVFREADERKKAAMLNMLRRVQDGMPHREAAILFNRELGMTEAEAVAEVDAIEQARGAA